MAMFCLQLQEFQNKQRSRLFDDTIASIINYNCINLLCLWL